MKALFIFLLFSGLFFPDAIGQELLTAECSDTENREKAGTIRRTCTYGDLQSVRIGTLSSTGHFRYSYELYRRINGTYNRISVTDLLNDNQDKLLALINRQVILEYTEIQEDPIQSRCAKNQQAPEVDYSQLGFSFDEFGYHFHARLDLNENCETYETVSVHLSPNKMKRYFRN